MHFSRWGGPLRALLGALASTLMRIGIYESSDPELFQCYVNGTWRAGDLKRRLTVRMLPCPE
jgi:hypothetical protein